jgi:hypothetical protein
MRALRMERMSGSRARLLAAAAVALALGAVEARANQTFNLSGVTFAGGGTATGSFVTTDALNSLVSANITTTGGTFAFNYTNPPGTAVSFSSLPFILVLETPTLPGHLIELTFAGSGLTTNGGTFALGDNVSFEQDPSNTHRLVTAGSVVNANAAVPEPSSLLMGGVATLAGLGAWARRRRARTAR